MINEETLYSLLNVFFENNNGKGSKEVKQKFNDMLVEKYNYVHGIAIFNGNIKLESLKSIAKKLIITKTAYEISQQPNLNPELYFTVTELKEFENYKVLQKENDNGEVIFHNLIQLKDDTWLTSITIEELANLYDREILFYNSETQRNPTVVRHNDGTIEKIYLNKKSVADMTERIANKSQFADAITINILQNGKEMFNYQNGMLKITAGELDMLDGFHRSVASQKALLINPECADFKFALFVTNYNVDKAWQYMIQLNKANKMSEEYVASKDTTDLPTYIVKRINENSSCDMKDKIVTDKILFATKGLTMFSTLKEVIRYYYKDELKTRSSANNISDWLIEFFNELIGLCPENFLSNNYKIIRKNTHMIDNFMFAAYIGLSFKLKGTSDWKEKLKGIMSKTDFSKENTAWEESGIDKPVLRRAIIDSLTNNIIGEEVE